MAAPVALLGDLVEVVTETGGLARRIWLAGDVTEAPTVEICRSTRLIERIATASSAI
ncbi:hypothetical protein [Streptomyces sp. NPDC050422]|uniref:hypothetical protein n=1 Tax=Streptomyces sp. NPDC050422 TaxID=3365614 RepID=UPI00379FCB40